MRKCDFNKLALHRLLLKPGPRPWTSTLKNLAHENCGKQLDAKKRGLEDQVV